MGKKEGRGVKNLCFENVVLKKTLESPWKARRSSQEINLKCSLEELMLNFQYFGHLLRRANSLEKTLMLGKIEEQRRRGWQGMS